MPIRYDDATANYRSCDVPFDAAFGTGDELRATTSSLIAGGCQGVAIILCTTVDLRMGNLMWYWLFFVASAVLVVLVLIFYDLGKALFDPLSRLGQVAMWVSELLRDEDDTAQEGDLEDMHISAFSTSMRAIAFDRNE